MSKQKLVILIGVIATLCFVVVIVGLMRKPSKSVITPPSNTSNTTTEESALPINTAYFTTTLPAGFRIKTQTENATATDVLQIVATQNNSNGQQIGISLATLGNDGLRGVSAYNLRIRDPATYRLIEFGGMPADVPTFYNRSDTHYGITGFWVRNGLYASIAVSGAIGDEPAINQNYLFVLNNWRWR